MATVDQLKLDIEELGKLQEQATRQRVKDIICIEIRKLQTEIVRKQELEQKTQGSTEGKTNEKGGDGDGPQAAAAAAPTTKRFTKDIKTYAWDQSDKFMKIYATDLKGIQSLPKENVTSEFTESSFKLFIRDLAGKDYKLQVVSLFDKIDPSSCYHKVKSDMVVVMLRKVTERTWAYVTQQEQKSKDKKPSSKFDDKKDPSEGLMDMMKQMYEDGDDEMKRTIAKAWTESKGKKSAGLDMDM